MSSPLQPHLHLAKASYSIVSVEGVNRACEIEVGLGSKKKIDFCVALPVIKSASFFLFSRQGLTIWLDPNSGIRLSARQASKSECRSALKTLAENPALGVNQPEFAALPLSPKIQRYFARSEFLSKVFPPSANSSDIGNALSKPTADVSHAESVTVLTHLHSSALTAKCIELLSGLPPHVKVIVTIDRSSGISDKTIKRRLPKANVIAVSGDAGWMPILSNARVFKALRTDYVCRLFMAQHVEAGFVQLAYEKLRSSVISSLGLSSDNIDAQVRRFRRRPKVILWGGIELQTNMQQLLNKRPSKNSRPTHSSLAKFAKQFDQKAGWSMFWINMKELRRLRRIDKKTLRWSALSHEKNGERKSLVGKFSSVRASKKNSERQNFYLGRKIFTDPVRVAVGIVSFNNSAAQLENCIRSAAISIRQLPKGSSASIYVIDNGSPSDAAMLVRNGVKAIPSEGNIGFGAGHNRIMHEAFGTGSEYYLALNPDGALDFMALRNLIAMSIAARNNCLIEALQFPSEHPKVFNPLTFDTEWASGACLLIPKAAYDILGGFDETFFMYCEDVDLSWRAKANGLSVKTCPTALFMHDTTGRVFSESSHKMLLESGVLLARKWKGAQFETAVGDALRNFGGIIPSTMPKPQAVLSPARFDKMFHFAEVRWG